MTSRISTPTIPLPEQNQVGRLARTGAWWTTSANIGGQAINVVSTAILARLLLPSDYGILGMVATLTAVLAAVSGIGLSWATVQRRDLTLQQVDNLFWLNVGAGFVLWGAAIAAAPILGLFYNDAVVVNVTRVVGISFAISGFADQPMALLRRAMRFRALTTIQLSAQAISVAVAIALALAGQGYWALVASGIANQCVLVLLAFPVSGYHPHRPRYDPQTRVMVSFGGYLALSSIVSYFWQNVDNIVVGKVWGATELGFYSRAYFLLTVPAMLFTGSLVSVMVPSLSALAHDRERMAAAYRKALAAIAFGGFPVAIGLAITAPEAVRVLYGPRWTPVVPILTWFSLMMMTSVISATNYWLYASSGRGRILLLVNLVGVCIKIPVVLIGVQFGASGVAAALAIWSAIEFVPLLYLSHRTAGISLRPSLLALRPFALASVAMGVASFTAGEAISGRSSGVFPMAAAKVSVGVVVYAAIAATFLTPWPIPPAEAIRLRAGRLLGLGQS